MIYIDYKIDNYRDDFSIFDIDSDNDTIQKSLSYLNDFF